MSCKLDGSETGELCVCLKDRYGRYLYLNRTAEILHNIAPGEMIGKTDFHWQSDNIAQRLRENDRQVLLTGKPLVTLETAAISGGQLSHWLVEKFPAPYSNGILLACIGIHIGGIFRSSGESKAREIGIKRLQGLTNLRQEILRLASCTVEARKPT